MLAGNGFHPSSLKLDPLLRYSLFAAMDSQMHRNSKYSQNNSTQYIALKVI